MNGGINNYTYNVILANFDVRILFLPSTIYVKVEE